LPAAKESAKRLPRFMGKRNLLLITLFWIMGLVSMPADAPGQSPPDAARSSLPPGVEIHAKAAPETATIGDPIRIDLTVSMPAGCRLDIPRPESQIGEFTILNFFPGPEIPDGVKAGKASASSLTQAGAPRLHHAQIVAAVYKIGKFTFPSIRMKLHAAEGKEIALSSPPVDIEIGSVLNDKNRNLMDLKKQAEIPGRWPWLAWCIVAVCVLALGAALWSFLKQKRSRPLPLTPAQAQNLMELAAADLRNLLARGLPESGKEKQFYILLSEIIKRILEAGYGIRTAEQTTLEIMSSLHKNSDLESGKTELIESFLVRCDVVKFAKYIPSGNEHEAASQDALQILEEAISSQQSADS
jgi:hypothetical protein